MFKPKKNSSSILKIKKKKLQAFKTNLPLSFHFDNSLLHLLQHSNFLLITNSPKNVNNH